MSSRPESEAINGHVRDFLIDVVHGHRLLPQVEFSPISQGIWGTESLAGISTSLTVRDSTVQVLVDVGFEDFNRFSELFALRNQPVALSLQDGTNIAAEIGHLAALGAKADIRLHHWVWTTPSTPSVWFGRMEGQVPSAGNLSLVEHKGGRTAMNRAGFRFSGSYVWYVLPQNAGAASVVAIDPGGVALDRELIFMDFHALQLTLGGGLKLDYLTGLDTSWNVVGAMSLAGFERPGTRYRPPVAHESGEAWVWLPEFFRLVAQKLVTVGLEPLIIPITTYLDSQADHLDGAYLKAQVGLEAFSKRIVSEGSPESLVNDVTVWKEWVDTLEAAIASQLRDQKQIGVVMSKFKSAMYAPSGDMVRRALGMGNVDPPSEVLNEIKKRNYPAHGFFMNKTIEHDIDEDARRLEMIQTVTAALIASYVGYRGPIHGYDVANDGGRLPPAWWPTPAQKEDVWVRYVGERRIEEVAQQNRVGVSNPVVDRESQNDDAIRERAYFLWLDRTGSSWWDPVSNWLEAERLERNAG